MKSTVRPTRIPHHGANWRILCIKTSCIEIARRSWSNPCIHEPKTSYLMQTGRLEAFSDGVLAIIITIMVLELHVPHGDDLESLLPLIPILLSYVLSFVYVGIYWNNHHHLFHAVEEVSGGIMWANLHLLFWLSLIPFVTGWMGENHFAKLPSALYGAILLLSSIAYSILQSAIVRTQGSDSLLRKAIGRDFKGRYSTVLYIAGMALSFIYPSAGCFIYAAVALIWLIPDRRIERVLPGKE